MLTNPTQGLEPDHAHTIGGPGDWRPPTKAIAVTVLGLPVAGVLLSTWWRQYSVELEIPHADPLLLTLGLFGMPVAVLLQVVRTGAMFQMAPKEAITRLWRPVMGAHAINTLGPGLGDLFEMWRVSSAVRRPVREVVATLVLRMVTTIAALFLLAAAALSVVNLRLCALFTGAAILGPLIAASTWTRWRAWITIPGVLGPAEFQRQRFRAPEIFGHTALAVIQGLFEAAGYFFISRAVAEPVTVLASMGVLSFVELISYLPIPLAGAGLHHWGAVGAAISLDPAGGLPATTTALHHGWVICVGILAGLVALMPGRRT